jgi:hypothetical protein
MRYAAERRNLDESIESCARSPMAVTTYLPRSRASLSGLGTPAPATHVDYELIGAAMLILAGGGKGVRLPGVGAMDSRRG